MVKALGTPFKTEKETRDRDRDLDNQALHWSIIEVQRHFSGMLFLTHRERGEVAHSFL